MQEHTSIDPTLAVAPAHELPPPPPAFDPQPNRVQTIALGTLLVVGVLTVLVGMAFDFKYDRLLQQGGFFLATYAFLVGASWLPPSVLSRRVDKLLDRWVRNSSGGYYGVMALSTFGYLELHSFLDAVAQFELSTRALRDFAIQTLVGFSAESLKNFVMAMAWPGPVFAAGRGFAVPILLLVTWGVFRLGREILPHANFAPAPGKSDKKKKK